MQFLPSAVAILAVAILGVFVWRLNKRVTSALGDGTDAKQLEATLKEYFTTVRSLKTQADELTGETARLSQRLNLASQKISIVRFNPFGDTGGDQSFSLAVLDAANSGYVLSCIHGRENTRTYIKPIDLGVSKYTLSKEEKLAIDQAASRVPKFKNKEEKDG